METTVKERLTRFLKTLRIKQYEFCDALGVSHGYVCSIRQSIAPDKLSKIRESYPELNIEWLLTGKGEMLNSTRAVSGSVVVTNNGQITGNNNMNVTHTHNSSAEPSGDDVSMSEVEEIPVIPASIVNEPEVDVYEFVMENETNTQPAVAQFPKTFGWYKIKSRAMEPNICSGDVLALNPYPQGREFIEPGYPYVVDTNTNGLVTRLLFPHPDGYRAVSYQPDKYPEYIIPHEHVIRIYRIVGLLRQSVQ